MKTYTFSWAGSIYMNLGGASWNGVHADCDDTDNACKAQVLFQYKF